MAQASSTAPSYVALLRGINVGGKNKLPMKDLVAIFEGAGCVRVRHYIQSGNVVFGASQAVARRVPAVVAAEIERAFGLRVPVVLRSGAEMRAVVKDSPLAATAASPDALHVVFLADAPPPKLGAALDPARSPPDTFVLQGREIYLSCPNGVARTKLTSSYFDSRLRTTSTMRNWRTVLKLVEMSSE
jgi:uncharacterized protein (DUF1697 family)